MVKTDDYDRSQDITAAALDRRANREADRHDEEHHPATGGSEASSASQPTQSAPTPESAS